MSAARATLVNPASANGATAKRWPKLRARARELGLEGEALLSERPGHLTDAPATGRIKLAAPPVPAGSISRADVAAVIAALLDEPGTRHQTLELVSGDSPVAAAVRSTF